LDVDFVLMKPQVALQALITGDVGYTTALGSTMRAGIRGLPLRVVMTIADKPLFALMVRPGINSVEELKGKLLGISSFGASSDTLGRAVLRRYKLTPNQDVKILALGGGTNRLAAMKSGAIDAALIESPYNVMLERDGFHKILFVGDLIPSPLAGFGTTLERIRKQPDEIQRLVRATLRGIQYAKTNRQESVNAIMKWAEMDQPIAEGSFDMAVTSWSNSGAANPQGVQIAMEEKLGWNRNSKRFPILQRHSIGASCRDDRATASLVLAFHPAEEILDRGFGDDTVELSSIVVDQTHMVDQNIVHFPLAIDVVHPVIDGCFTLAVDDLGFHTGLCPVPNFARELNFISAGRAYRLTIRYQKPLREGGDEFTLLPLIQQLPVWAQGALRHFRKVETGKDQLTRTVGQPLGLQFGYRSIRQDRNELVDTGAQLVRRRPGTTRRRHRK
jgi:ABC-type nitrate/sulfonate/bicarbonate transport system substrate-binding protein